MKIYHYDKDTKEFLYISEARINPLQSNQYLIPVDATNIKPELEIVPDKAIVWNGASWVYVDDNRGKEYWDINTKERFTIENLSQYIDTDKYTEIPYPDTGLEYIWQNNDWVLVKPIAYGNSLIAYIEDAFKDRDVFTKAELQGALFAINLTLRSTTCNPLLQADFEGIKLMIQNDPNLSEERKNMFINLANNWEQTVNFT